MNTIVTRKGGCRLFLILLACSYANSLFAGSPFSRNRTSSVYQSTTTQTMVWTGSREDVERLVAEAATQYGFESGTHKGRDVARLKPASMSEMMREISRGNVSNWKIESKDNFHQPGYGIFGKTNVKFTNPSGDEVVYSLMTGEIVKDENLGTFNFVANYSENPHGHIEQDVAPHQVDDKYKFVGILFESDPANPNVYHIIDGQTGRPLTQKQVHDFPSTLTDMWKDQGLVCTPPLSQQQQDSLERWSTIDKVANAVGETGKELTAGVGTTVSDMKDWLSSVLSSPNKSDFLKSLADLLETGEEIVEVRERKAAEEERLRQQQLAAQRKQNQKRESETKSNKATTRETPKSTATSQSKPAQKSTTPTQTKQTTTVTTQPKQTVSASFDMSKLTSIYEKRMAVLEEIYALPDGEPASADQRQKVNAYLDEYKAELSRLEKVLDNGPKNNTWFNYGLELNIKKDGQTTLMTRMMQRCRNAGKF